MPLSVWPMTPSGFSAIPQSTTTQAVDAEIGQIVGDRDLRHHREVAAGVIDVGGHAAAATPAQRRGQRRAPAAIARLLRTRASRPRSIIVGADHFHVVRQQFEAERDRIAARQMRHLVEKRLAAEHRGRVSTARHGPTGTGLVTSAQSTRRSGTRTGVS